LTVKTEVSRFHIHDELTAPDESAPILKSIQAGGAAVSKFVGVLAGYWVGQQIGAIPLCVIVGFLAVGVILMFVYQAISPEFFRRRPEVVDDYVAVHGAVDVPVTVGGE